MHIKAVLRTVVLSLVLSLGQALPVSAEDAVLRIYAAGSLRSALTEAAAIFGGREGVAVQTTFGSSGLLRDRLQKGEPADIFASADMSLPQSLADAGLATPPVAFARSRLCAMARPGLALTSDTFLDVLLRSDIRVGTSTPGADPGGDYAWALFRLADKVRPGSFHKLDAKALKLVGGPVAPEPPAGQQLWPYLMERADVFLIYCNSAETAVKQLPGASIVAPPAGLEVTPEYGLSILASGDRPRAERFLQFLRSPEGAALLTKWGFIVP
jgi:ABC-type molybdate transport system substrate-binding protein